MSGDRLLESDLPARSRPVDEVQVQLAFAADASGRTWLARQRVAYPFHVGRCLSLAGDPPGMATVYVQCCSGGLFEGDAVKARVECGPGTRAQVTTSASTIVHSMEAGEASQAVEIDTEAASALEYLPEPLILFPAARLTNCVRIRLHEAATVLVSDATLTHDPGGTGRRFDRLSNELVVESSAGRLLARDRWIMTGTVVERAVPGITGTYRCQGSFLVLRQGLSDLRLLDEVRAGLNERPGIHAGASHLPNGCGIIVRLLSTDAAALKGALRGARCAAQQML